MMFVYPTFLWALLAITIPIIIHLFNFRRYKKVYFTNVRFLKELQHESKSKSRLKEILVLLARCLTIAALVMAFAQPLMTEKKNGIVNQGSKAISIYIDNSFSMDNVQKQGRLIDIAKQNAKEIVKVFNGNDKFQIITNDFEGKHQRFYTKEDVIERIEEIKISAAVKNISDVLKRQNDFINLSGIKNKSVYLLSDAQKTTFDLKTFNEDTLIKTVLIPLSANRVNNVYIDSCWFESPLQQKGFIQKLHAKIVNNGAGAVNAGSAKLFLNKQQLGQASYSIEAFSKTEIQFSFECKTTGFNYGSIKIEDYPVSFDDEMYFSFNSRLSVNVSLINGKNIISGSQLETLFNGDSLFRLMTFNERSIDYGKFSSSDIVFLNELSEISSGLSTEIKKFIEQGGTMVLIPAKNADLNSYKIFLQSLNLQELMDLDTAKVSVEKIEAGGKFYSGVFERLEDRLNLPIVNNHFRLLKNSKSNLENILTLQNGDVILGESKVANGNAFLFTCPLDFQSSNFSKHAIFVPTVYRMCFASLRSPQINYQVNANSIIKVKSDVNKDDMPPRLKEINGKADVIPEMHKINNSILLHTRNQIVNPGFYELNRGNEPLMPLAFNYSRKESDLSCFSTEELEKTISDKGLKNFRIIDNAGGDISKEGINESEGRKLWKLFIILALTFIIIEILLLRFLK